MSKIFKYRVQVTCESKNIQRVLYVWCYKKVRDALLRSNDTVRLVSHQHLIDSVIKGHFTLLLGDSCSLQASRSPFIMRLRNFLARY